MANWEQTKRDLAILYEENERLRELLEEHRRERRLRRTD